MNTNLDILNSIDPTALSYEEWLHVGMALQHEGATSADWEAWSSRDTQRFKTGECERKWAGFRGGNGTPITAGTLVEFAKRQGWSPPISAEDSPLDWDDVIQNPREDLQIIDPGWVQDAEVQAPSANFDPVHELRMYLTALFESSEYVGYVVDSWVNDDGRSLPKKGNYGRTAGELLHELAMCGGDLGKVLGDYNPEVGAWIRFNPLDGKGVRDENVTSFRYALIESDTLTIERQAAIYAEMELPAAILVHSGKKSLHAIVRIDATSKEEYRDRVTFLHRVCKKNGLDIDTQNKNPSRLSRMPGVMRAGRPQYVVGTNQGKASWDEWRAFVEEASDNLPDFESLASVFNDLPDLAPPLIDGVLREGHKMLISGPSKAGKSYLLLQLVIAIAEGGQWVGWPCAQGRVLYVNLELDRASCLHRLKLLYGALGLSSTNIANIDLWNLRGNAVPMDQLAPKLIRRARKLRYRAIIIDPIYKVLTGSENEADDMAKFCNHFDRVCTELGAAVIYCHHHSKGTQGQKASRDRSSGSGVFARDPDAILDIIELHISDALRKQLTNRSVCDSLSAWLDTEQPGWREEFSQDDALVADKLADEARKRFDTAAVNAMVETARVKATNQSGWRLEGTLREFPPIDARRFWFVHPTHSPDTDDLLLDAKADGEEAPWQTERREKTGAAKAKRETNRTRLIRAWNELSLDEEPPKLGDLADSIGVDERDILTWLKTTRELVIDHEGVVRTREDAARLALEAAIEVNKDLCGLAPLDAVAKALKRTKRHTRRMVEAHEDFDVANGKIVRKGAECSNSSSQ